MSEKKFNVQPGDEIVIKLPKKKAQSSSGGISPPSPPRKAMLPTGRAADVLPRRLQKGGLLNFYDVGLKKTEDGDFADWDFSIVKPTFSDETIGIPDPTAEDFARFDAELLEMPLEDWRDNFKRITPDDASDYDLALKINDEAEIALDDANPDWSADGLKIKKASRVAFDNFGAFHKIDTGYAAYFKITAEPDFNAETAVLNLSKGGDVFLLPVIAHYRSEATLSPKIHRLDYIWLTLQRAHYKPLGFFRRDYPTAEVVAGETEINEILDYFKTLPNARHLSIVAFSPPPGTIVQTESLASYPAADGGNPFLELSGAVEASSGVNAAGRLLAVIVTPGAGNFFIWAKSPFAGYKAQNFSL